MNQRIFVLDDDEVACQLAETVLIKAGYEVKTETRSIGASSAIKSFKPDLILLDVMMPAISGENLVEILYKTLKQRPKILYYSNLSASELQGLVQKTGVDGYVCKVEGPQVLINSVKGVLRTA